MEKAEGWRKLQLEEAVGPQVSLVGHSAGAQLAAMALLHRAKHSAQQKRPQRRQQAAEQLDSAPDDCQEDGRMPKRLVGKLGWLHAKLLCLLKRKQNMHGMH